MCLCFWSRLLILDEMDILLKGKGEQQDLYRLFEWAHRPHSSLIFVGIANSIDLTERYLPYLRTRDCT
jgi:cell division control protein 6